MNPRQLHIELLSLREKKEELLALQRLLLNPDFKRVILDGYLGKHPIALTMSKGQLGLEPSISKDIDRQLDSVALFNMYLNQQRNALDTIDEQIMETEELRDNNPG